MMIKTCWGCNDDGKYHMFFEGVSVCSLKVLLTKETIIDSKKNKDCCQGCINVQRKLNGTMVNVARDEEYMKTIRARGE